MIYILFYLILIYILFGFINSLRTFTFLKKEIKKYNHRQSINSQKSKIIILIPVLREQELIHKNLEIFSNLKGQYELLYITTQKEDEEKKQGLKILISRKNKIINTQSSEMFIKLTNGIIPLSLARKIHQEKKRYNNLNDFWNYIIRQYRKLPSTHSMINEYIEKKPELKFHVSVFKYPYKNGLMAHQLNYACRMIAKKYEPKDTYILVYNADSSVYSNILEMFYYYIDQGETVIMQSSIFLENYKDFANTFKGNILRSIGLVQTRWTLWHEIPRIRRQYERGPLNFFESAHVVGHGTCIRLDVLLRVNGFPEIFLNEDLPLGYFLALDKQKIKPACILENSQSPTSITSVITQYTTWFYGPAGYFKYYRYAIDILKLNKHKAQIWALVNIIRAIMWLLTPWVWLFLTIVSLVQKQYVLLSAVLVIYFFYTSISYLIINSYLKANPQVIWKSYYDNKFQTILLLTSPIAFFLRGLGPNIAFYHILKSKLFKYEIKKLKTER